jgi:hypothetical protein
MKISRPFLEEKRLLWLNALKILVLDDASRQPMTRLSSQLKTLSNFAVRLKEDASPTELRIVQAGEQVQASYKVISEMERGGATLGSVCMEFTYLVGKTPNEVYRITQLAMNSVQFVPRLSR